MLTAIDKNLLIAALESALLYAQTSAGVASLEDLTTQVQALRTAFDADPANVTDAQIEQMIATLQAVEIPDPAALSRLLTTSNITDTGSYLAVCSWATLLNKPATFPPAIHRHNWSEVDFKPYKYEPKDHAHAYADITDKPTTFAPDVHAHAYADITEKPTTFAPSGHTHLVSQDIEFDVMPGHMHRLSDIDSDAQLEFEYQLMRDFLLCSVQILPTSPTPEAEYQICDGTAISRSATFGGVRLTNAGCQFGTGDGSTTVNVPTLADPLPGLSYYIYIGLTT